MSPRHRAEWSPKHAKQWAQTLAQYAAPELGKLLVSDITTGHVVRTLEPIWPTVNAERLRGRVEAVLDWAAVHGYREGDNPARWRGNLDKLLPKPSKSRRTQHHAALPYAELPTFVEKLRRQEGSAARALEFAILTAARTGEVLRATPAEIDYANKIWTVPADRMKARREHRVPMSAMLRAALELKKQATGSGEKSQIANCKIEFCCNLTFCNLDSLAPSKRKVLLQPKNRSVSTVVKLQSSNGRFEIGTV